MKALLLVSKFVSMVLVVSAISFGQSRGSAHAWVGVWDVTDPAKAGGVVTIADDGGALEGTITFNVKDRETDKRIAIEVRSLVNPHMEGDAVVFEVRGILKPHRMGETDADVAKDTELAQMRLEPAGVGKARMVCANCGSSEPIAMAKEE